MKTVWGTESGNKVNVVLVSLGKTFLLAHSQLGDALGVGKAKSAMLRGFFMYTHTHTHACKHI